MSSTTLEGQADDAEEIAEPEHRAQLDLLQEENRRLREAYAHSRRTSYRRTALALFTVGALAVGSAALFSVVRDVLLALGAVGVFGAVLTYYLTPERFVAASVGERVFAALDETESGLVNELGLSSVRAYVPTDGSVPVRLFIPQQERYELPPAESLNSVFVVESNERSRGVSLVPTGAHLFREFTQSLTEPLGTTPDAVVPQLTDALVEDFELARSVDTDLDAADGRLSARIADSAYGAATRVDHPISSFLAVGLAGALDAPVTVEGNAEDGTLLVTCRWDVEGEAGAESAEAET